MIPGAEYIFRGEGGEVTYLFLLVLVSLAVTGRAAAAGKGRSAKPLAGVVAGLLLFCTGRGIFVADGARGNAGLTVLSLLLALAGFYMLMTTAATGRREEDYSFWNPGTAIAAISAGIVLATGSAALRGWRTAGDLPLTFLYDLLTFAPAGIVAGLASRRGASALTRRPLVLASSTLIASAALLSGMVSSGTLAQEAMWRQFSALADITGLFLFLTAFMTERDERAGSAENATHGWSAAGAAAAAPVHPAGEAKGTMAVEIGAMIAEGRRKQKILDSVSRAAAEDTGAEFVIVRMAGGDGEFEPSAYILDGRIRSAPRFETEMTAAHFDRLCSPDLARHGGFVLGREDLGEDLDYFIPSGLEWTAGRIVVVPVRKNDVVRGFITAGFFRQDPPAEILSVMRAYALDLLTLLFREDMKRRIRESSKSLALTRDELEAANQLKSNFLSIVSHELRTPLTSVKAYTETLLDNVATIDRDTIKNFLVVMGEENDRVIKLVDNMLNYTSMETGHLKVEKKVCNLNGMILEAVDSLRKSFDERKVNSDVRLPKHDVEIDADPELISQLLGNLISNAVKFTPQMGKVTVSLEEEASAARIVVQDTGRGIPEDQLEKVFERFHQVDASDTREFGGSGLGLAICKNIVEWHDGNIWVENVKEAGARFVVMLPMKDIIVRHSATSGQIGSVRFERERYLSLLVEMMSEFLQAKKASIMLLSEDASTLNVVAAKGLDPEFVQNTRVEPGERIAGKVLAEGKPYHVFDIEKDDKVARVNNTAYYGTNSFISVPLLDGDRKIGVINVSDHVEGREFTSSDAEILEAFSGIITRMLGKLSAYETVSLNFEKLKAAMKSILHIREVWGSRNLNNYTLIALAIGRRLGLQEESMTALRMGMNMYDLGMMKIPRSIRIKKEELSETERKKLREHPDLGYALLSPMGLDDRIMKMVRYHHEFFDGSGYPEGLVREEIPVEARILCVIDAFRALITLGPYRRAYTIDEARGEIIRESGSKFDPRVVGAFVKVLHELGAHGEGGELLLDAVEKELEELRVLHDSIDETLEPREETR